MKTIVARCRRCGHEFRAEIWILKKREILVDGLHD